MLTNNKILNSRIHFSRKQLPIILLSVFLGFICLYLLFNLLNEPRAYLFQQSYWKYNLSTQVYNFAVISDMDKNSKINDKQLWRSIFKRGQLIREENIYRVNWIDEYNYTSPLNEGGRGMELSELAFFNGALYTGDDRTGIVFKLLPDRCLATHILMDGDGTLSKGFKIEWATVKDDILWIGGLGKPWESAEGSSDAPMWVKSIDIDGIVEVHNWKENYDKLVKAARIKSPGYLLHEAVAWNPISRDWWFFPRRVSHEPYDEVLDEERCGNIALVANQDFSKIRLIEEVGPLDKLKGFSSVKFIPFRQNEVVVLKTREKDFVATYMSVIDLSNGNVLMSEIKIGDIKYF
eukprot:TRINITY_DN3559_c1_g1_i1.p1 TRINITY_DN3559_c1_g1~~TRINITY_DN3559_c1_g1_i1.p1  ORF type:complete len:349 (-),score=130.78 TRINITY_DN3559_c1_g1_i1:32-1078(-)